MATRAQEVGGGAGLHKRKVARALPYNGIPDLNGSGLRVCLGVAQRYAKQICRDAGDGDVDELTRLEHCSELGSRNDDRVDAVGDLVVRNDLEVMDSGRRWCGHGHSNPLTDALDRNKNGRHPIKGAAHVTKAILADCAASEGLLAANKHVGSTSGKLNAGKAGISSLGLKAVLAHGPGELRIEHGNIGNRARTDGDGV